MVNIRVGCSALIEHENKLLLGIRDKEPNKGMIITPGGGIDIFEHMEETVKREIMEETGVNVCDLKQLKTYEIIDNSNEHRIIIYWSAKYNQNTIVSNSDLKNANFYTKNEIKNFYKQGKLSDITIKVLTDNNWL